MSSRNFWIVLLVFLVGYSLWRKQRETVVQHRLTVLATEQMEKRFQKGRVQALLPARMPSVENALNPESESNYQTLLEKDAFCATRALDVRAGNRPQQFLRALGLKDDPRFGEMAADDSPLYSDPNNHVYRTPLARLIQALRLSGDLNGGRRLTLRDAQQGWNILTELHRESPENAAFLLFRLGLEDELDYPMDQRAQTAQDLMRANEYNSLQWEFYREVLQRSRDNASKFLAGETFLASLPTPSFAHVKQGVRELELEVPGLSDHVGRLLTRAGLDAADSFVTGGYNPTEYNVGRDLASWLDLPRQDVLEENKRRPRGDLGDFVPSELAAAPCSEEFHQHVKATLQTWF
jgi:hypothetical protein